VSRQPSGSAPAEAGPAPGGSRHKPSARTSTVTPVEPPLEVASAQDLAWDDEADVLVVGWGAAGACAALEARAAGASVLVLDRFGGGGASVLSGGVVYAGGGTPYQQQAGFDDSPEAMFEYLRHETQGVVSDETLRRFCGESVNNLAWLEKHGVRFAATMPDHKTSYPPDGVFLYHSGNEAVPAYAVGQAKPAPRGHRAVARGQSGATLYAALQQATRASGARTLTQTAVRRVVREQGTGRILGVEAKHATQRWTRWWPSGASSRRVVPMQAGRRPPASSRRRPAHVCCVPTAAWCWPPAGTSTTRN